MAIATNFSLPFQKEVDPYREGIYLAEPREDASASLSILERVCRVSFSLLTLHPGLHFPLSLLMEVKRIKDAKGHQKWLAIGQFCLSILHRPLASGWVITQELIEDAHRLSRAQDRGEVCHLSLKISHHLLYLAMRIQGGVTLCFLSSAFMAALSLSKAAREFKKDLWIEAGGELIVSSLHIHKLSQEWEELKKVWQIDKITQSIFAHFFRSQDRSQYGNSTLLNDLFINRHSGTQFDEKPLTREQMVSLVQAARWTPSSYNDQPWNFIFCERSQHPEAYEKVIDSIYGQEWVEKAPLLIVSVARPKFTYNQKENLWAQYDTGAAALSLSLQATALGLMSHQIGGFDGEAIRDSFGLPEGYQPLSIIAVGYESASIDSQQALERTRRDESENFFFGDWGSSFPSLSSNSGWV